MNEQSQDTGNIVHKTKNEGLQNKTHKTEPLSFMYIFFFPLSPTRRLSNLAMRVTRRVSHKKQALLTIREPLSSSLLFGEVCVTHIFSFLFCVFCFVSLRSLSCVQCCQCLGIVHSWLPLRQSFDFELYLMKVFQKRVVCTKFDIYVFNF
jgi:hypothetical protein